MRRSLRYVEALYRRHRQPAIYRLTSLVDIGSDRRLAERGYRDEGPSLVLYQEFGARAELPDPAVQLSTRPSRTWLAAMAALQGHTRGEAALYRRILGHVAVPAAFASVGDGPDGVAALAVAAVHRGVVCYHSVVSDPNRRRQGYGRRIMAGLAHWAAEQGARAACLEVEAANRPALALYDRLGFRELYRYHYRRQPG